MGATSGSFALILAAQPMHRHAALVLLLATLAIDFTTAQCTNVWLPGVGYGLDLPVSALATAPSGDVYGVGSFQSAGGQQVNGVARWDGAAWSTVGSGVIGYALCVKILANGDVVVGGLFTVPGVPLANNIARWDGLAWHALGAGVVGTVRSIDVNSNGDVIVGGSLSSAGGLPAIGIAQWNGSSWSAMGDTTLGSIEVVHVRPNGEVIAAGFAGFPGAGEVIVKWNGATWVGLGGGLGTGFPPPGVLALTSAKNGDLIAGGYYLMPGFAVARWDDTAWQPLGPFLDLPVWALLTMPNGDIAIGGAFAVTNGFAVWDGSSLRSFGLGLTFNTSVGVTSIAQRPNGELVIGGAFSAAGGQPSAYFARLDTTCPATAATVGALCTGSGGPNVLAATSLPWLGATFRARATGLAPNSLAVAVFGFTALAIPMPSVHALGTPGCTLLVDDDILIQFSRGNGQVDSEIAIPALSALVGATFRHQVIPIELDLIGNLAALTATNALLLTVGTF